MSFEFTQFAASVKAGAPITERDTLALRQWSWADGKISKPEAEALFDLNSIGKSRSPEWIDCFVEAISVCVLETMAPTGVISAENAAWLMGYINKTGHIESLGEMELLVKILEKATDSPPELKAFALKQIERIILNGTGPTRFPGGVRPNVIDPLELVLLRRLLSAQSGEKGVLISNSEAAVLFRIKDATLLHDNAPGWQDVFVRSLGHYVLSNRTSVSLPDEVKDEMKSYLNLVLQGAQEADDLQTQIDADVRLDPLERALLSFVLREIHEI